MQVSGVLTFSKEFVSFGFDYFSNKEIQYNSSSEIAALKVILFKELHTLKTCGENDGHSDPCAPHHLVRKYLMFDYLRSIIILITLLVRFNSLKFCMQNYSQICFSYQFY